MGFFIQIIVEQQGMNMQAMLNHVTDIVVDQILVK